jgi:hypothetical protein
MPSLRVRFTIRALMVLVAVVAIWLFIILESITYRARHAVDISSWQSSK